MDNIEVKLNSIERKLTKIESYLYDDDETDNAGIVKKVRILDGEVAKLKENEKVKDAKSVKWGTLGGAGIMALLKLIELIFTSHKS